jgi:hypothetical protein
MFHKTVSAFLPVSEFYIPYIIQPVFSLLTLLYNQIRLAKNFMQSHALGAIYIYGQLMHKKWCLYLDTESLSKKGLCHEMDRDFFLYINGKIKAQLFSFGFDLLGKNVPAMEIKN